VLGHAGSKQCRIPTPKTRAGQAATLRFQASQSRRRPDRDGNPARQESAGMMAGRPQRRQRQRQQRRSRIMPTPAKPTLRGQALTAGMASR